MDEERKGWIYGLFDTEDPDRIRYVGKTIGRRGVKDRVYHHVWVARKRFSGYPCQAWIRKIGEDRVGYRVLEEVSSSRIDSSEISWISRMKSEGMADLNLLPGGEGRSSESMSGEYNPNVTLTRGDVDSLRHEASTRYVSRVEAAARYGISPSAVSKILQNDCWYDPDFDPQQVISTQEYNKTSDKPLWRRYSNSEVEAMRSMYLSGKTIPEIHRELGVPVTTLKRCLFDKYGSEDSRARCVHRRNSLRDKLK